MPDSVCLDEPGPARASSGSRVAMVLAALALLPSLSGCVAAAVAVPMAAAAGLIGKNVRVRAATAVPERTRAETAELASTAPRAGEGVTLTALSELPTPSIAGAAADPWRPFVDYAIGRAADSQQTESALLQPGASTTLQARRRVCPQRPPAVIVDLDIGQTPFAPARTGLPSPGLREGLARLREAGIVVLWISQASANEVRKVADALQLAGLDPTGRDPLLLVRHPEDRKQTLRQEANLDVCVIAIAGDRRGDFDELFDYLRDPALAAGLETMLGAGWFLAPTPFGTTPSP